MTTEMLQARLRSIEQKLLITIKANSVRVDDPAERLYLRGYRDGCGFALVEIALLLSDTENEDKP